MFFQEHDIGVWVSRAVPTGNGAKKGIQHGDQLAAINGSSSLYTTIDEVAQQISNTTTGIVELTFLRYVGPLRPVPGSITQEGFEISDSAVLPSVRDKTKETQSMSIKCLLSKKSSLKFIPKSPKGDTQLPGNTDSPSRTVSSSSINGLTALSTAPPSEALALIH